MVLCGVVELSFGFCVVFCATMVFGGFMLYFERQFVIKKARD